MGRNANEFGNILMTQPLAFELQSFRLPLKRADVDDATVPN
jgi:hypothetical protein